APTTLICPGEQWTDAVLTRALDLGLRLVGSYYVAIRHNDRFCWAQHICAPYLDRPDAAWFASQLPVIGCFHDYELAREGVGWMAGLLDRWQDAGARRFIDFRELVSALESRVHLRHDSEHLELVIERSRATPAVRPIPVRLRVNRELPRRLVVN